MLLVLCVCLSVRERGPLLQGLLHISAVICVGTDSAPCTWMFAMQSHLWDATRSEAYDEDLGPPLDHLQGLLKAVASDWIIYYIHTFWRHPLQAVGLNTRTEPWML